MELAEIRAKLIEKFGDGVVYRTEEFRGEMTLFITAPQIVEVSTFCRDTLKFNFLADIAGVDYLNHPNRPRSEPRFGLNYHLYSLPHNKRIRLKVLWDEEDAPIPSVTGVWASADWEEREAFDMFGIQFSGHPDLRRILMPADWDGYPQRKDYPLGYETVQFSFNFDEIQKHKPYAKK
jgi:NADH-quinone oxidoreductase subunit C